MNDFHDLVAQNNLKRPLHEQERIHFMAVCDLLAPKTPKDMREAALRSCQEFLARRVGCSNEADVGGRKEMQPLVQFLATDWPASHADAIEELFRGYIRAGMAPVNDYLYGTPYAGSHIMSPSSLEYAVTKGRTPQVRVLIEEGADYTVVPKGFELKVEGAARPTEPTAFLAFVQRQGHLGMTAVAAMHAAAVGALMRRHIQVELAAHAQAHAHLDNAPVAEAPAPRPGRRARAV